MIRSMDTTASGRPTCSSKRRTRVSRSSVIGLLAATALIAAELIAADQPIFKNKTRTGTLIVNRELADEVVRHFQALYRQGFQIERMVPVEDYGGDDDAS